ncbi:hypothetical protein E3N88_22334 [Mikania micrantha]|uniref:Uncharacterized protein n=1 Tax=Mikania micrantha TaxID=192012 RepID=A0A5N6NBM7_9ASTR|nr:hypothetical protein E3N88_22334 [Mikania micrantha]
MLLAVLIANSEGNILVERFNGVPGEERLHWRSFLVKLGADNLKGVKNEELLVACHKSVYIVYTVLGHVSIYLVGKDDEDVEDTVCPESAAGKISFSSFCYSKGSGPVYNDGLLGVGQSQPNTSFNSHPSEKGYQPRGEVSQPNRYSKAWVLWLPEHGQANSSDNSPNQRILR